MILAKKAAVLIAAETTRQTMETLTAANAFEGQNIAMQFVPTRKDRPVFKRSLGGAPHALINLYTSLDFEYILRVTNSPGTGSASSKEIIDPMLRGCGMTATYTAETSGGANDGQIKYTFAQAPTETVTIWWYNGDACFKIHGAVGDCTVTMVTSEFALCRFHFEGFFNDPISASIPADIEDYFSTKDAVPCVGFSYYPEGFFTAGALKGLYLFNTDVTEDFSGKTNTLTNNNTVIPYDVGCRGVGATFTAASSMYLSRAYDADFNLGTGDFTIFGWFRHGDTSGGIVYILDRTDGSGIGPEIYLDTNGKLVCRISDDGAAFDTITSGTAYDDSAWHFFLYQRSSTALTLRVDDVADGSATVTNAASSISGSSPVLNIGRKRTGANYFNGQLLWLGIAAEALSSAQQRTDMYSWVHDHCQQEFQFAFGNKIDRRIAEAGIVDFRIVDRNPSGRMRLYHPSISVRDFYAETLVNNPSNRLIQRKIGVATANAQVVVQARAVFSGISVKNSSDYLGLDIPFGIFETSGNINDQAGLIFK